MMMTRLRQLPLCLCHCQLYQKRYATLQLYDVLAVAARISAF